MDKIEALVEELLEEYRELIHKPDEDFTEQDRCKLIALNDQLKSIEQQLPKDYFTAEKSWNRFVMRFKNV